MSEVTCIVVGFEYGKDTKYHIPGTVKDLGIAESYFRGKGWKTKILTDTGGSTGSGRAHVRKSLEGGVVSLYGSEGEGIITKSLGVTSVSSHRSPEHVSSSKIVPTKRSSIFASQSFSTKASHLQSVKMSTVVEKTIPTHEICIASSSPITPLNRYNVSDSSDLLEIIEDEVEIGNRVVFYYTGHGEDSSIILPSHKKIPLTHIMKSLLKHPRWDDILIILDCCHPFHMNLPYHLSVGKDGTPNGSVSSFVLRKQKDDARQRDDMIKMKTVDGKVGKSKHSPWGNQGSIRKSIFEEKSEGERCYSASRWDNISLQGDVCMVCTSSSQLDEEGSSVGKSHLDHEGSIGAVVKSIPLFSSIAALIKPKISVLTPGEGDRFSTVLQKRLGEPLSPPLSAETSVRGPSLTIYTPSFVEVAGVEGRSPGIPLVEKKRSPRIMCIACAGTTEESISEEYGSRFTVSLFKLLSNRKDPISLSDIILRCSSLIMGYNDREVRIYKQNVQIYASHEMPMRFDW